MKAGLWLLGVAACAAWGSTAEPERVAQVERGELKEARASWWGFDKEDATRALQAAIDSRVPRLIVDHTGAPWVTDRLTCVSDQEIVFEPGVEVLAKKGAFTGKGDALFSLVGVTNVTLRGPGATLRMRRADYDAPPYAKAEWRHVLNIKSSAKIQVLGLTLAESGGDGIYLGCLRPEWPNRDIMIRDVVCDRNYRQGISVISAEDLLIENTVMRDTAGTPPAAGIDFEPNAAGERLVNCVMRNCVTTNNQGSGYDFYLPNLTKASEPVSIRIENCRSANDRAGVKITTGNAEEAAVRGALVFSGCRVEGAQRSGVTVSRKPAFGLALAFEGCAVAGCMVTNLTPDVQLVSRLEDEWPVGGIRLDGLTVSQPVARPWIGWQNNTAVTEPVAALTGTVSVEQGGTKQEIRLTPEWAAQHFPPRFTVRVPRVAGDLGRMRVVEESEGLRPLEPMRVRRSARYVFFARAGREAVLVGRQSQVGRYGAAAKPLRVTGPAGQSVRQVALPGFGESAEIRFVPESDGFFRLDVEVGANAFALLQANVPVALDATAGAVDLIASTGSVYAWVPAATDVFAFGVAGEGEGEAVQATVLDPAGQTVWSIGRATQMERCTVGPGQSVKTGLWRLSLAKPAAGGFEDFHVEVLGVAGYLFLDGSRYWRPSEP